MSKSLGNFYTLRDLQKKGYTGEQIRYLLVASHYRTQLNFTFEGLEAAKASLARIQAFVQRLLELSEQPSSGKVAPLLERAFEQFCVALADDLNVSVALSVLFELLREVNTLCDAGQVGGSDATETLALLKRFNTVLGVLSFERESADVPRDVLDALEKREQARAEKNWALADALRDQILQSGYVIVDTAQGAKVKVKGS